MPLVSRSIVIDANRGAETGTAVGAARNHHIGAIAVSRRLDTAQHVNVIVCRPARAVNPQEDLARQSTGIDGSTNHAAAHVHGGNLIKAWRLVPVLCVARPNAPEAAS